MATVDPDQFDRVAKLVVDSGDAPTFAAAADLLRTYRLQITADAHACTDAAWQAALLTAVNAGVRAVHGGVRVSLDIDPVCVVPWAGGRRLSAALAELGAERADVPDADVPTIAFGRLPLQRSAGGRAPVIQPVAGRWLAGISPVGRALGLATPSVPAAVLAACIAVSESFQWLRGHAAAGDRDVLVSLWDPEGGSEGPEVTELPAEFWLLGLGHLGQAYAWLIGALPYAREGERSLVLQDDDRLSEANRATSMLHRDEDVGLRKTRLVAGFLEPLGWDPSLVERRYIGGRLRSANDSGVLLGGVDNAEARRLLDDTGFALMYDAGLGAGPDGFLGMTIRRLPGSRSSRDLWPAIARPRGGAPAAAPAYAALEAETGDRCGVELLAGRTVATSFVGVTAACWVVGGLLRELHGGSALALVDYSLRDPARVVVVAAPDARAPRVTTVPCVS